MPTTHWRYSRNSHNHTNSKSSLQGDILGRQGRDVVTSSINILEYRRKDGRISESKSDKETSSSGFSVIVLSEDDVHICQWVPEEGTASYSGRSDCDNHTDQGSDEL
jgi:hypothetical protein